jgi:hypothetical protein
VLLGLPAEAQEHRFEDHPVVMVRENFIACDVLLQLQRVMDNPRFLLAGDASRCAQGAGPHLRKARAIRLHLPARHDHALQMDARGKRCRNNLASESNPS